MKAFYLTIILFLASIIVKAQQNYDIGQVSKSLLPYAKAVVRYSDESIELKAIDNNIYHIKQAVTILNKNGDDQAEIVIWYNKSNAIKNVKGSVFSSAGKLISKFSEKDFEDVSAASNSSLFEDSRIKHYQPAVTEYPYTVEYEYEVRSKQTLNLYDWHPNPDFGVAVEASTFSFISKPEVMINIKEINTPEKPVITVNAQGQKIYLWKAHDLKPLKSEPFSPNPEQYLTVVKISPEKFSYEGITGTYANWRELGKWVYDKLLLNRDQLPAETSDHIKEVTAGLTDPKLKAKKIYEYMQQKTRYVSIQAGIGGYQPFLASEVDKTSYGDCKALVNYTHALLKSAGIDSWYCMVKSGSRKKSFMPDFASMDQGDHVILCLPFKNDTTWLECTSQKIPFGFLGDFTDDRLVLACTPEGGKLLHTPRYNAETNLTKRKGNFTIDKTGELVGDMETTFSGTDYDERYGVIDESYTEQLKYIKNIYPINNLNVTKLVFVQAKNTEAVTTEDIKLDARDFASLNADKYYFKVNLANRTRRAPDEVRNRTTDVYINRGFSEDDEITYQLPAGYHPDKLLLNRSFTRPFGKFTVSMHLNGQQLTYKRLFILNDGNYSKDSYQELIDFYQDVADADSYTMTLVKNS